MPRAGVSWHLQTTVAGTEAQDGYQSRLSDRTRFARRGGSAAGRWVVLGLVMVFAVMVFAVVIRTLLFTADRPPLPPPSDVVTVDDAAAAKRLAGAIRIPTVTRSDSPHFDPAVFARFHGYLQQTFPLAHTRLSTETVAGHSLLFTWKGAHETQRPILLMAHQDVVPVEEGAPGWTYPPFSGAIRDGYIWGRGTLDVKQGLLGILEAVEHLLQAGFQPRRTIYLAFGHDEEIGGSGARAIAALLASRGVELAFVVDEGGVLTKGIVPGVEGWVALIGIAEKGYVSLKLSAEGTGGHSSMPPQQTALGIVASAVATLEANPFPARTQGSKKFFGAVGPHMPFFQRMIFANLWLFEPLLVNVLSQTPSTNASIRTTTAPTIFRAGVKDNLLPKRAEAVVNFRIVPGETPASVKAHVESLVDDDRVAVEFYGDGDVTFSSTPSRYSSTEGEGFVALSKTIREIAQDDRLIVAPYLMVGGTDSRHYEEVATDAYRFLFNRFGPEDLSRIHGKNERIEVSNYAETIRFYAAFIARVAGEGRDPR